MRLATIVLASLALATATPALLADNIPYPNPGQTAPTVAVFANGQGIDVYFAGSNAGFDDFVSVYDPTTGYYSGEFFEGHNTALGTELELGTGATGTSAAIDPGDPLVFCIESGDGNTYCGVPSDSADGINHAYVTTYSGGSGIPAGLYVGFEDSYIPGADQDYNDDSLVFTGVTAPSISTTPEPSSLVLLGTGLISACGFARRKLSRS